jgi:hypothetical protein
MPMSHTVQLMASSSKEPSEKRKDLDPRSAALFLLFFLSGVGAVGSLKMNEPTVFRVLLLLAVVFAVALFIVDKNLRGRQE